jgi:hypothetical protein
MASPNENGSSTAAEATLEIPQKIINAEIDKRIKEVRVPDRVIWMGGLAASWREIMV